MMVFVPSHGFHEKANKANKAIEAAGIQMDASEECFDAFYALMRQDLPDVNDRELSAK